MKQEQMMRTWTQKRRLLAVSCLVCLGGCTEGARPAEGRYQWSVHTRRLPIPQLPPVAEQIQEQPAASEQLSAIWELGGEIASVEEHQILTVPAWGSATYFNKLKDLIVAHPRSRAAATARFEVACALLSRSTSASRKRARYLFSELADKLPDEWHGVLASRTLLVLELEKAGYTEGIASRVEAMVPTLRAIETDLPDDLVAYDSHLRARPRFDFTAGLYLRVVEALFKQERVQEARGWATRLLEEYPDSSPATFARNYLYAVEQGIKPYAEPPPIEW